MAGVGRHRERKMGIKQVLKMKDRAEGYEVQWSGVAGEVVGERGFWGSWSNSIAG